MSALRRGYVLPLVILVLIIAAASMTSICRMSLEKAVQANRAEADLERRWALISCREVLLPKAEAVLRANSKSGSEVRRSIQLGRSSLNLIFGDEQAKANVNLLYAKSGLAGAERGVRAIVGGSGGSVAVELRPIPGVGKLFGSIDAPDDEASAFETFEQVLPHALPGELTGAVGTNPSLTSQLTFWGDGSLRLQHAARESVRAILAADLASGDINRLLDACAKNPEGTVAEILDTVDFAPAKRERAENLLSDDSACHSLWIISDGGDRIRYDLSIAEGSAVTLLDW